MYIFQITVKTCPDPGTVNHASKSLSNNLNVGSVVTYTCDNGYVKSAGSLTRTCQSDKSWDGSTPTCSQSQAFSPSK